jgi:cadmium resistance protein CadD (predicted permease)
MTQLFVSVFVFVFAVAVVVVAATATATATATAAAFAVYIACIICPAWSYIVLGLVDCCLKLMYK